jgi:hypothetical protein
MSDGGDVDPMPRPPAGWSEGWIRQPSHLSFNRTVAVLTKSSGSSRENRATPLCIQLTLNSSYGDSRRGRLRTQRGRRRVVVPRRW